MEKWAPYQQDSEYLVFECLNEFEPFSDLFAAQPNFQVVFQFEYIWCDIQRKSQMY